MAAIQFPRLDVRAALIHHWLDKSFVEDAFLTGSYVMDPSNFTDETFSTSIVDLVTPQDWELLENLKQLVEPDWNPYTTRARVLTAIVGLGHGSSQGSSTNFCEESEA